MTNIIQIDKSRGFTRMDNSIIDALMAIDLPARELKVALFVAKTTINFNAGPSRIKAVDVSKATNIHPDVASKAISHLLKRRVLFRDGGSRGDIGICDPKEWIYFECPTQTNRADSDQSGVVVSIASQTKSDDSLLYTKKEPLVTLPTEEVTAPPSADGVLAELNNPLVSFTGEDFQVDAILINRWENKFPGLNIAAELDAAASWAADNPRKAKKDWQRFLSGWMRRASAKVVSEGTCPVDKIIDLYHRVCPNLAPVSVTSDKALRSMIVERWNESEAHQSGGEFWKPFFLKANNRSDVFFRGSRVAPRLEALVSRAVFREIAEARA